MSSPKALLPERDSTFASEKQVQICKRCIMDSTVLGVRFDAEGICSHCKLHDKLDRLYPAGEVGRKQVEQIADKIRKQGRGKRYDCIVGLSGGRDTSYCLYQTKQLGLRPLAVHFDNGWDSDVAKNNMRKVCDALNVDLHTDIADWEESRELTNCTIRASVPYIDVTDDIGIARTNYDSAVREGVRYIMVSHSFREEGINPIKWMYIDGRYVDSLIKQYGRMKFKKFKNIYLRNMFYWHFVKRIKMLNLTNYYDDAGKHVEQLLEDKFGWTDTHQHHNDNEIFALVCYYSRHKFGIDWRLVDFSAKIRTGAWRRPPGRTRPRIGRVGRAL